MTVNWEFDFADQGLPRKRLWPAWVVGFGLLLGAAWWHQHGQAEEAALRQAVAEAQEHLKAAQQLASARAQAARPPALDENAWDVAWLDERLRELEACVPGQGVLQQWQYKATPRGARVIIKEVPRNAVEKLLQCLNSGSAVTLWRLQSIAESSGGAGLEVTLNAGM